MARRSRKKQQKGSTRRSFAGRYALVLLFLIGVAGGTLYRLRSTRQNLPPGAFAGGNVLLVTIDTLRADRLGSYGSTAGLTPHLDRLAAQGIRFANAFAHVPVTLPSHASMLTGRYPTEHGVRDNGAFRLDPSVPTLASVLRNAGYATGAFVSAFVLDARFGLNQGFDLYDDFYGEKREFLTFAQVERRADAVLAPAEQWIRDRTAPWFAWVHFFDPHTPYDAPAGFDRPMDPYGAEVAYTDSVLGKLLERLHSAGKLDETLVVVVGDHGESLGDHGEKTHGTFAYNATLKVPWILWSADAIAPQVFHEPVRHVDLMPTVLDLVGVASPPGISGQSLRPFLNGDGYDPPPAYFEALNVHLTRDWAPLRGVIDGGYKLVSLPIPELYDLERDPSERRNLYRESPEVAARLETTLAELIEIGGGELELAATAPPDRETLERLRALGYVTAPAASRKSDYTAEDDPKRLVHVSNAYDEVTELFGQGRIDEAIPVLEDIVRQQPRSSEAYRGLAYALYHTGRLGEAIAVLERGIANGVQEPTFFAMLGAYLLDAGDVSQAAGVLETLVSREPDYAEARNSLAIAYGRMGRFDDARRELEAVLELDPSSATAYNNLGTLALSRGDVDGAIHALNEALEFDPTNANTHNGLGVAYARKGDAANAVASWKRAVEANPAQFDALYNLALLLAERAPRDALPYLKRFVNDAPPERYGADIARARARILEIESS